MDRRFLLFVLIVITGRFSACTLRDPSAVLRGDSDGVFEQIHPGQTSLVELGREFGEPLPGTYEFNPGSPFGRFQVQLDGGYVLAATRAPASEEVHLQYWRHRWKGYEQDYALLGGENRRGLYRLRASELGAAVIYDPGRDQVIRVVKYDPR